MNTRISINQAEGHCKPAIDQTHSHVRRGGERRKRVAEVADPAPDWIILQRDHTACENLPAGSAPAGEPVDRLLSRSDLDKLLCWPLIENHWVQVVRIVAPATSERCIQCEDDV